MISSNIKEPSCVCRQYWWENFQANQTSSRSHALLMVSPQTNSSDIKNKYWADVNIYVEPIWYIETSNTWNNAMMEHTNIFRFLDGNPRSDKSKEIFCDNWIQGWISLVWEKNRIAKCYCSHKSPVIIKLQKDLKNLSRNSDKYYIWEIKARSKEIVQGERSSDSKVASGNKRSGEARKVWFTRFNHFSFLFCFHLLIDWSPSFGYVDVQYVFWR